MRLSYIDPGSGYVIFNLGGWLLAILVGFLGAASFFFRRIFNFFKRNWKPALAVLAVALAAAGFLLRGVIMGDSRSAYDKRIVILGMDGLSPEIMEPMMDEGALPNFAALRREGSYGRLATTNPSQSPVAWAAFATGRNPGKNGMYDFIVRDPASYGLRLSLSSVEKGKARRVVRGKSFWHYASERDVPSVIICCPVTFPPDEIKGKMLSGMGVPDILGTEGTFSFYTSEPQEKGRDTGGRVLEVRREPVMTLDLIGPRTGGPGGKPDNVKVPMKVTLAADSARLEFQGESFDLKKGEWSGWHDVSFKVGLFSRMKGIVRFRLVETEPHFKLYASPINFDPRDPYFPISHPAGYSRELASEVGLFPTQGLPLDTWAVNEGRLDEEAFLQQAQAVLGDKIRIFEKELGRAGKGIFFAYFGSSDIVQHMFWRYTDAGHPAYQDDPRYREVIRLWYRRMDDVLGRTVAALEDGDTLLVLSDHGFETFRRAVHVNSWLRANGYLELRDPGAAQGAELLSDIDWSSTRAYALGFGGLYLNLRGRERDGVVEPGREADELKAELARRLLAWKDKEGGEAVVRRVYDRGEIFKGPLTPEMPDLYLGFNRGYRASWQTAIGGVPPEILEDNAKKWSGDHLFDPELIPGVIFANRRGMRSSPGIYDIAPTVLSLIGYDEKALAGMDLDGRPLF